jgi:hypothetical protein
LFFSSVTRFVNVFFCRARSPIASENASLNRAVGQALAATALAISDDPLEMEHGLGLLQGWLQDEAVIGELSRVIDPQPGSQLDTDALTAAFEEAGFDPDTLSREMSFADVMVFFANAFYNAAAGEDALNEPIKIGLLREMASTNERQVALQECILAALEKKIRGHDPYIDVTLYERTFPGIEMTLHFAPRFGHVHVTEDFQGADLL